MLRLAIPVLVEQVLHMLVGFSETILAGRYLGADDLAAMGMMNYILWLLYTVFQLVAIGASTVIAHSVGGGDWATARKVPCQALLLGTVLAVVVAALGFVFRAELVALLGLSGTPAVLAARYLAIFLPWLPLLMVQEVGIACLRGAGDTVTGLVAMLMVNLVNIAVCWSLVRGFTPGGMAWGWDALPIGAACGTIVGGVLVFLGLYVGRGGLALPRQWPRPDVPLIRRVLRVGLPGGCDMLALVSCHLWYVTIINGLGPLATAAHGVGVRIESMSYLPGYAFQVAAQTMVGQYLGAGDRPRARRAVLYAIFACGTIMCSAGLLLFLAPRPITSIFLDPTKQSDVLELVVRLLPIVACAMPALTLVSVLSGSLRGAGDTRITLLFTFVGLLLVRIPLTYYLAYATLPFDGLSIAGRDWGVAGAWTAMVADIHVRCLFFAARFRHGGWQHRRV